MYQPCVHRSQEKKPKRTGPVAAPGAGAVRVRPIGLSERLDPGVVDDSGDIFHQPLVQWRVASGGHRRVERFVSLDPAPAALHVGGHALQCPVDRGEVLVSTPDGGEHPYVGQLLFYVPTDVDPRFDTPGGWFNCTGTLIDSDTVVTAVRR